MSSFPDPQTAALLASPVRRQLLDELSDVEDRGPDQLGGEGATATRLAKQLSLHVSTVRFHLDQLVAAGLVTASFHKHIGAGRPRKVYSRAPSRAEPDPLPQTTLVLLSRLLMSAFAAQSEIGRQISPEEAGRRWALANIPPQDTTPAATAGQWIGKVGQAMDLLADWGYSLDLTVTGGSREARLELGHCPFRELAEQNSPVVCGIHRGLLAGTMSQLGEPGTVVDLEPFADGDVCIAHLSAVEELTPKETR